MEEWPDFSGVNWGDLYQKLLLFAVRRVRRYSWPRDKPQPQEFVQRAILKALSRERIWDCKKNLFENLCQIISNLIYHERNSYDNKNVRNVASDDEAVVNISDCRTPEDIAYEKELERKLLEYLASYDRVACKIGVLMLRGVKKSESIAIQLGLSVREIENGKKRLRRLAQNYLNKIEEELRRISESSLEDVNKVLCLLDEN